LKRSTQVQDAMVRPETRKKVYEAEPENRPKKRSPPKKQEKPKVQNPTISDEGLGVF